MKKSNVLVLIIAAVAAVIMISHSRETDAAQGQSSGIVGKMCTVQFRRDALGAAMNLPVSPMTGGINGAEVAINGKIRRLNEEWLVIERNEREVYIPRPVILLFEVHN